MGGLLPDAPDPIPGATWAALPAAGSEANLRYVSHLLGVDKATSRKAILEVCGTLQDVLGHTVLQVHEPLEVVVGFLALGFLQYIGALDRLTFPSPVHPGGIHPYNSWLLLDCASGCGRP